MACPVCDETAKTVVNIRMQQESDLQQLAGSPWDGRNMARCDGCGVLYDHRFTEEDGACENGHGSLPPQRICPDCGSRVPGDQDTCSYCDATLA